MRDLERPGQVDFFTPTRAHARESKKISAIISRALGGDCSKRERLHVGCKLRSC